MNKILWILQIVLGLVFFVIGVIHFVLPAGLPERMAWMYALPAGLHYFSGAAEILGALGLVLPGALRTQTRLTPLAALGLAAVMLGAAAWHLTRGEPANVVTNVILAAVAGLVAFGRWRLSPLVERKSATKVAA